jgi:hypothetical protein
MRLYRSRYYRYVRTTNFIFLIEHSVRQSVTPVPQRVVAARRALVSRRLVVDLLLVLHLLPASTAVEAPTQVRRVQVGDLYCRNTHTTAHHRTFHTHL